MPTQAAHAATFTVPCGNVYGPSGLKAAMDAANAAAGTLTDTAVVNNTATDDRNDTNAGANGAGIFNNGPSGTNLVMSSSAVNGNVASALHGQAEGGGIFHRNGSAKLTNSVVQNNTAQGSSLSDGGGIYRSTAAGGAVTLTSTPVTNNHPNNCGGDSIPGC